MNLYQEVALSFKKVGDPWIRIFSSKECLLLLASNDRDKYLLTQDVRTGKQVRRQAMD